MEDLKKLGLIGILVASLLTSPICGCGKNTEEKTLSETREKTEYQT
ncbi:MAG: hypothetical protein QXX68_01995 [Candidatus Pacearchaeota archaeon]